MLTRVMNPETQEVLDFLLEGPEFIEINSIRELLAHKVEYFDHENEDVHVFGLLGTTPYSPSEATLYMNKLLAGTHREDLDAFTGTTLLEMDVRQDGSLFVMLTVYYMRGASRSHIYVTNPDDPMLCDYGQTKYSVTVGGTIRNFIFEILSGIPSLTGSYTEGGLLNPQLNVVALH